MGNPLRRNQAYQSASFANNGAGLSHRALQSASPACESFKRAPPECTAFSCSVAGSVVGLSHRGLQGASTACASFKRAPPECTAFSCSVAGSVVEHAAWPHDVIMI